MSIMARIMGTCLYLSSVTVFKYFYGLFHFKVLCYWHKIYKEKRLYSLTAMRSRRVNSQQVNDGWSLLKIKTSEILSRFHRRRDRLVVRTLRCGRSNPGSNPGHGTVMFFFLCSVSTKIALSQTKDFFSFARNDNISKWLVSDHFLSSRSQFSIN